MCPGKISQANTTGSAPMLSSSRHSGVETKYTILSCAHTFGDRGSSGNSPPRHSTKSEKTYTSAFNCSKKVTCYSVQDFHGLRLQSSLHGSSFTPQKGNCLRQCISRGTATQFPTIQPLSDHFFSSTKGAPVILFPEDNLLASTLSGMGGRGRLLETRGGLRTTAQPTAKRTVLRYHSVEVPAFCVPVEPA